MRTRPLTCIALGCALALPAGAILIRPDRDDEEYLELATRYPAAVRLHAAGGDGVLIAPRWVLTAAHRAERLKPAERLDIGGRAYEVQATYLHREWKRTAENDVALVFLRAPVTGLEAAPVYRERDENGKTVAIVGHGATGRIGAAAAKADGRKRAAINTIDRVAPAMLGLRIKQTEDASDLQGAAAGDETGGPLFVEAPGGIFVAGILAAADGEWQSYGRVSTHAQWIDDTMFRVAREEAKK